MPKILIIEDEKNMVTGLKFNLEARDYEVSVAYDGEAGLQKAIVEKPDLVLLDIMLPKLNGYEVCKRIKKAVPELPIIMLTAKSQEAEIVTGLELGADDYITKPFSVLELLARINAMFRRVNTTSDKDGIYHFGNIELDFKKNKATKNGNTLELSAREFEIIKYLIQRQGETVSRDELLTRIWGYESSPNTRTVDIHIAKLRSKIEDKPDSPELLITVHGIGYKFL